MLKHSATPSVPIYVSRQSASRASAKAKRDTKAYVKSDRNLLVGSDSHPHIMNFTEQAFEDKERKRDVMCNMRSC